MTEDEMYELAKRVHPPERSSPPTLKVLCMDFTINHYFIYVDLNEEHTFNALENMCKKIQTLIITHPVYFLYKK